MMNKKAIQVHPFIIHHSYFIIIFSSHSKEPSGRSALGDGEGHGQTAAGAAAFVGGGGGVAVDSLIHAAAFEEDAQVRSGGCRWRGGGGRARRRDVELVVAGIASHLPAWLRFAIAGAICWIIVNAREKSSPVVRSIEARSDGSTRSLRFTRTL